VPAATVLVPDALVVVVATEVGRMGAAAAGLLVVLVDVDGDADVEGEGEGDAEDGVEAGHSLAPHARSVGQQPPPRVVGQDW